MPDVAILNLATPLPLPITEASKYNGPAEYPEPEETTSAEITCPLDTTTFAVAPCQLPV
jgi:hypothetical protein